MVLGAGRPVFDAAVDKEAIQFVGHRAGLSVIGLWLSFQPKRQRLDS